MLYGSLRPKYGWIDASGENAPGERSVAELKLKCILWANFFGPEYVGHYGRDFLLGAPGWLKEELADGGILYVPDESYYHWLSTEANEVVEYFQSKVPRIRQYRSAGFKRTDAILEGSIKPKRRKRQSE